MSLRLIPELHRATHALGLAVASIPGIDVDQAQAHVLAHLHARGSSRINDIHAAFGHRRSTLTSVLDRLAARGLIERSPDPDDRRSVRIVLTRRGRAVASRVHEALFAIETAARSAASARDVVGFLRVAGALAATSPVAGKVDR